jgi:hypothetical protein
MTLISKHYIKELVLPNLLDNLGAVLVKALLSLHILEIFDRYSNSILSCYY